jgi:adenine phosphoribosyltransferase
VIEKLGGEIVGCAAIIDLPALGGSRRITALGHRLVSLVDFEGE